MIRWKTLFDRDWEVNGIKWKIFEGVWVNVLISEEGFNQYGNVFLFNELNYNMNEMWSLFDEHVIMLNENQKIEYDHIIHACNSNQGIFFL